MGLAVCHTCDAIILFGGVKRDGYRFCGRRCAEEAELGRAVEMIPEEVAEWEAHRIQRAPCPACGREETDVDLRRSFRVTGFLLHTSVTRRARICCKVCGAREAVRAIAHSLVFGWWGFPWGLVLTPWYVLRNVLAMIPRLPNRRLSPDFVDAVRLDIAAGVLAQGQLPPLGPPPEDEAPSVSVAE